MAVSKRLRYEVLRRDGFTCRYCGAKAPDVELTVDHVTPRALGGTDTPDNLVASCADCNTGKTSSSPDAPLVADVSAEALEWAQDVRSALYAIGAEDARVSETTRLFLEHWADFGADLGGFPLPDGAYTSVERFVRYGASFGMLDHAMQRAMYIQPGIRNVDAFRYFCGIIWSKIKEAEDRVAGRS